MTISVYFVGCIELFELNVHVGSATGDQFAATTLKLVQAPILVFTICWQLHRFCAAQLQGRLWIESWPRFYHKLLAVVFANIGVEVFCFATQVFPTGITLGFILFSFFGTWNARFLNSLILSKYDCTLWLPTSTLLCLLDIAILNLCT